MTEFNGPHSGTPFDVTADEAARFWALVHRADDGCWLWRGKQHSTGYGAFSLFRVRRGQLKAHRVAYTIANGPIPSGRLVMHTCDNPMCVNPAHLRAATATENMLDCARKRRNYQPRNLDWECLPSGCPDLFRDLVRLLGARDATVFAKAHGLYGFPRCELRQVASEIDYTREGVRQIVIRSHKKILQEYAMSESTMERAA